MSKKTVNPSIESFLIADKVIQEKNTNKWSIIGIFDKIYTGSFPCIHSSLSLYIRLSGGWGKYKIKIEFCDDQDRVLGLFEGIEIDVKDKLAFPGFGINTTRLQIPQPGKYWFKLYFNDEFLEQFPIQVVLIEENKK